MAMMVEKCSVCKSDVSTATAKVIKLNGDRANGFLEQIQVFLYQELSMTLDQTTIIHGAYACYKCRYKIDRYFQLIQDINMKRDQLLSKYLNLGLKEPTQSRKRKPESILVLKLMRLP